MRPDQRAAASARSRERTKLLDQRLREIEDRMVRFRVGEVVDTSPLTIVIGGGSTPIPAKQIAGTTFAVDDVVAVLTFGADLIVLGVIA